MFSYIPKPSQPQPYFMEGSGKEREKYTEAGKNRTMVTNTVGTNNLSC